MTRIREEEEDLCFIRLATGNQCNECSSGAAWLKAGSEQIKRAVLF